LASDYARPITAVKLDCRRLSPADRPNKTRIFSGITALPAAFLPRPRPDRSTDRQPERRIGRAGDFDLVFYGERRAAPVDIPRSRCSRTTSRHGWDAGEGGGMEALALFFPARRTVHAHADRKELTPAVSVNKFKARLVSRIISRRAWSISAAARPKITA